jgi:hypothetical protein
MSAPLIIICTVEGERYHLETLTQVDHIVTNLLVDHAIENSGSFYPVGWEEMTHSEKNITCKDRSSSTMQTTPTHPVSPTERRPRQPTGRPVGLPTLAQPSQQHSEQSAEHHSRHSSRSNNSFLKCRNIQFSRRSITITITIIIIIIRRQMLHIHTTYYYYYPTTTTTTLLLLPLVRPSKNGASHNRSITRSVIFAWME